METGVITWLEMFSFFTVIPGFVAARLILYHPSSSSTWAALTVLSIPAVLLHSSEAAGIPSIRMFVTDWERSSPSLL